MIWGGRLSETGSGLARPIFRNNIMKYHIVDAENHTIASFVYETDRDLCLDAVEEFYSDCYFSKADDE